MMDISEKLVELQSIITCPNAICNFCEHFKNKSACERHKKEVIADNMIAHGVTVQECGYWVSLTDCANAGVYCSVCHKKVYKEDYAWCNRKNKLRSDYCPHCGAKMMPQPPKGE